MKEVVEQDLLPILEEGIGTGKWKPYQEYKYAEVEWLGKIPEHWMLLALKRSTIFVSRGSSPEYVVESSIKVINQACIQHDGMHLENVKYQQENDISKWKGVLFREDVLINSTGTGTLGRVGVFNLLGTYMADSHVTIIRPDTQRISSYYLKYLLQTPLYQILIYTTMVAGSTNQVELSREKLCSTPLLIPTLLEQHAITIFLDQQTARISKLVSKKERMIELLQEQRTAIINQAVTKGLTPDVPMKDSGVEWLGEIPAHWEVRRLKFIADVLPGVAKGRNLAEKQVIDLPYLRVANVQEGHLDLSDVHTITVGTDEVERYSLRYGDVLMNEGGDFDKLGRGFIWDGSIEPCLHQNHVFAVRPLQCSQANWINIITQTNYAKHYFILKSKQSTNLASISKSNIEDLPIVLPKTEETDDILMYISDKTAKIDKLTSRIQVAIKNLKEYSSALISAAVTGKIDVRDEVAGLTLDEIDG